MTSFNPLGSFDPHAPLNPAVVAAAQAYKTKLPEVPDRAIDRIYLHWTVGHWNQDFPDYNGAVRYDGQHFSLDIPGDPRDNAIGVNAKAPHSHTFMRNTGAFGLSADGMVGASEHDYGPEPITMLMLEYLAAAAAAVAARYAIDLAGVSSRTPYAGEPTMLTHAEAADRVGSPAQYAKYGPDGTCERWDLASFVPLPPGVSVTSAMAYTCGCALRARAHLYKIAI